VGSVIYVGQAIIECLIKSTLVIWKVEKKNQVAELLRITSRKEIWIRCA